MISIMSLFNARSLFVKKMSLIIFLIMIFTFIFSLCDDEEFGGILKLNKKIEDASTGQKLKVKKYNLSQKREEDKPIHYVLNRLYFVLITTTTVGYGDIYPSSVRTKLLTGLYIFIVFCILNYN